MGILSRFGDIMSANINAFLDKAEDPEKMVDQQMRKLREEYAEVKQETAAVMANEKAAKRSLDECQAKLDKYQKAAENAVAEGNDDDTRKLLASKQQIEKDLAGYQKNYDVAKENADKMRKMHDKLASDIQSLDSRRDMIKAKTATAKAQKHMNEITAGSKASEDSLAAFDRMEAKADKMLDEAEAESELNEDAESDEDLADKYAAGGDADVESELAAMKAKLGKTDES